MFTLICDTKIFPRPTPWIVAWQAAWAYINGMQSYRFVYLPAEYTFLTSDDVAMDGGTFMLRQQGRVVLHTVTEAMTWQIWLLYLLESWLYGPLLKFWKWRWKHGGIHINIISSEN